MSETENRLWRWFDENWFWLLIFGSPAVTAGIAVLARWSPAEIIGLTAVLSAAAIVVLGLAFWRQVRLRQADAALKQALLQRELSVEEIERLITCPAGPPQPSPAGTSSMTELAACLQASGVSAAVTEQVFTTIRVADPSLREAICDAICGLGGDAGDEASEQQIVAVLRGLGGGAMAAASHVPVEPLRERTFAQPRDMAH